MEGSLIHFRFWEFSYITTCLKHCKRHQTFTNCVLKQKCRDEKYTYVIIYGYVSLRFMFYAILSFLLCSKVNLKSFHFKILGISQGFPEKFYVKNQRSVKYPRILFNTACKSCSYEPIGTYMSSKSICKAKINNI